MKSPVKGSTFKDYLKNFLEEEVTKCNHVLPECEGMNIKIAMIKLVYNNSEMLKLLIDRGKLLDGGKYDKLEKLEEHG